MSDERIVKPRLTNFGDGPISDWHRETLGYDMPAVDIDFLLVEYDQGLPCAVLDYKHSNAKVIAYTHPSVRALRELCNERQYALPYFTVKYAEDMKFFQVFPMNQAGLREIAAPYKVMADEEFIEFQQRLRIEQQQRRRA